MIKKIILLTLLTSCSSISYKDCASMDWYEQGLKDGEEGRRQTYFLQHTLKCAVIPDNKQYMAAREIGLEKFCTIQGGIKEGQSGQIYFDQCKGKMSESLFKHGYEIGKKIYSQKDKVQTLEEELDKLKRTAIKGMTPLQIIDLNQKQADLTKEIKDERTHLYKLQKDAHKYFQYDGI